MSTYLVVDLDIHDPENFAAYRARVGEFVERHGGECLARGGDTEVYEGDFVPHRVIMFRFPDRDAIHRFYADHEYQQLAEIRHACAQSIAFSVDGL